MSRSDPFKKKPKCSNKTLLAVGEGKMEQSFLNQLRNIYLPRDCGVSCTLKDAGGGDPKHVIEYTLRLLNNAKYDRCLILVDSDRMTGKLRCPKTVRLFQSVPCIESLLISILEQSTHPEKWGSKECKKYFEKKYSTFKENDYQKPIIENARKRVNVLNNIIDYMVWGQ